MFLDSDLTRSFIFDPLLVLLREIDIFHWGWNNGNFPLEINSRSINIFPYFWLIYYFIFLLDVFFIYNNTIIISSSLVLISIFFYLIFTLNSISKKMIRIKIHWKRNKIVQNWKLIRLKYFNRFCKNISCEKNCVLPDFIKDRYVKSNFDEKRIDIVNQFSIQSSANLLLYIPAVVTAFVNLLVK